jgi:SAM-dependent methyltransferase
VYTWGRRVMAEAYDTIGFGYSKQRRPDPRIASALRAALDGCRTVVNVGAGTGSYEPDDLAVVAVEPSLVMIRQRRPGAAPVVRGRVEMLPFRDASFDAVLGVLTLHHWDNVRAGLVECVRVVRKRAVFLTVDIEVAAGFWLLRDYFPDIYRLDREIMPSLELLRAALGRVEVRTVVVPANCADGFLGAYWRRPLAYLNAVVRAGISAFSRVTGVDERIAILREDLRTGRWARRWGHFMDEDAVDLGYRIVIAWF